MIPTNPDSIIALDVGEKRIGVAHADVTVRVPVVHSTIDVNGLEMERLRQIIAELQPVKIVLGYPRNQQGEATAQTKAVKHFARELEKLQVPIVYQDESLTSVLAEKYLKSQKRTYSKADIDAQAAAIILGDYLEAHY